MHVHRGKVEMAHMKHVGSDLAVRTAAWRTYSKSDFRAADTTRRDHVYDQGLHQKANFVSSGSRGNVDVFNSED